MYNFPILEVAANKHSSLPSKHLLVLGKMWNVKINQILNFSLPGDKESGKTTLLAKLQGNEDPKKGSGLDYNYIDVRDDEGEEQSLLSLHVLDGDQAHANLLRFGLSESNYGDSTVMICASMATPWAIMDQLSKWINVLQVWTQPCQSQTRENEIIENRYSTDPWFNSKAFKLLTPFLRRIIWMNVHFSLFNFLYSTFMIISVAGSHWLVTADSRIPGTIQTN